MKQRGLRIPDLNRFNLSILSFLLLRDPIVSILLRATSGTELLLRVFPPVRFRIGYPRPSHAGIVSSNRRDENDPARLAGQFGVLG